MHGDIFPERGKRLEPLSPVESCSGDDNLSALRNIRSAASFVRRPHSLSRLDKVVKAIGKVYRSTMRDYGSFHEFLRTVDFAGKFYGGKDETAMFSISPEQPPNKFSHSYRRELCFLGGTMPRKGSASLGRGPKTDPLTSFARLPIPAKETRATYLLCCQKRLARLLPIRGAEARHPDAAAKS